jgi:MFS family permease
MNKIALWSNRMRLFIVLFTLFCWRQFALSTIAKILETRTSLEYDAVLFYGVYYLSTVFFTIVSAFTFKSFNRKLGIKAWPVLAIASSIYLLLFGAENIMNSIFYLFFAGASFGIGIPFGLAHFGENTSIENRGRYGAVIFFFTSFMFVAIAIISKIFSTQHFMLLSLFWAFSSLVLFLTLNLETTSIRGGKVGLKSIIGDKRFIFYFIPWIMFCFIDAFEGAILENFVIKNFGKNFITQLLFIETSITAFAIIITGFLIDYYGRRQILVYGFITLGIAYALIGVASWSVFSWYVYATINGFAIGIFVVTFVFTIWGDLSPNWMKEGYYAIGSLPYFLIVFIRKLVAPYILTIPVSAAFSFASFFLFLAVWPLFNAPETLPEELLEARRLRSYVEKAKQIREKYAQKS